MVWQSSKRLVSYIVLFLLVFISAHAASVGCSPPGSGTWILTNNVTVCDGETVIIGDVTLTGTAILNLTDSDVTLDGGTITLEDTSMLYISGSSIDDDSPVQILANDGSQIYLINSNFSASPNTTLNIAAGSASGIVYEDLNLRNNVRLVTDLADQSAATVDSVIADIGSSSSFELMNSSLAQISGSTITSVRVDDAARASLLNSRTGIWLSPNASFALINAAAPGNAITRSFTFSGTDFQMNLTNVIVDTYTFSSAEPNATNIINTSTIAVHFSGEGSQNWVMQSTVAALTLGGTCALNNVKCNGSVVFGNANLSSSHITLDNLSSTWVGATGVCSAYFMGDSVVNVTTTSSLDRVAQVIAGTETDLYGDLTVLNETISSFGSAAVLTHHVNVTLRNETNATIIGAPIEVRTYGSDIETLAQGESIEVDIDSVLHAVTLINITEDSCDFYIDNTAIHVDLDEMEVYHDVGIHVAEPSEGSIPSVNDECTFDVADTTVWSGVTGSAGSTAEIIINDSNFNHRFAWILFGNALDAFTLGQGETTLIDDLNPGLFIQSLSPVGNYTTHEYETFSYNISVRCVDGNCGNVTLTLDPEKREFEKKEKGTTSYQTFRRGEAEKGISGVIIELSDEPLVSEYVKRTREIDQLTEKAKKKSFLMRLLDEATIRKRTKELPLALQTKRASLESRQTTVETEIAKRTNARVTRRFSTLLNAVAIDLNPEELASLQSDALLQHYVKKIYPLRKKDVLLNESLSIISAQQAWVQADPEGHNLTGYNMTIAIIDTGIDYTHSDLGSCDPLSVSGSTEDYDLESVHPYTDYYNYSWNISRPGFSSIAVHFSVLETEYGYDYLNIIAANGSVVQTLSGSYADLWSSSVAGDSLTLNLVADEYITDYGFVIDRVLNGSIDMNWSSCRKVIGGYDFANEDPDPKDDHGHGTHCAGIAAGNGTLKGVAPDAQLYAYKVLDSYGSGWDDDIIAGIEAAMDPNNDSDFSDHVDVISLSLGGTGEPFDAISTAASNAVMAGVVVVVAAGNSGPDEETVSSPGCSPDVITVGATYKNNFPTIILNSSLLVINDSNSSIASLAYDNTIATDPEGVSARLMYAGNGTANEFSTLNYSGKVCLADRGISTTTLSLNAENAGCLGLIVANYYPGIFYGDLSYARTIPIVSVSQEDGRYLYNMSLIPDTYVNLTLIGESMIVAEFSSRGPAYMYQKPDVLAPGVDICSARLAGAFDDSLCIDSTHASLSGTSMATPHVAGAAALVKQMHPQWTPYQIKAALEYTAQPLGLDPNLQGAGIINISAAAALANPPPIALIRTIPGIVYR
jgi:subtilisin family serine protease